MKSVTQLGSFEDVIAKAEPEVAAICSELRNIIRDLHPDCVEVPRPSEPSAAYGFGEKKMSEAYAYIMPHKNYANLGFYHGANLATNHLLEGSGKKLRHIKVRTVLEAKADAVRELLKNAAAERARALGLSNGSRTSTKNH